MDSPAMTEYKAWLVHVHSLVCLVDMRANKLQTICTMYNMVPGKPGRREVDRLRESITRLTQALDDEIERVR